jgi:hypothetical protein
MTTWPFHRYVKSPSAILAEMSRKIRRTQLCGGDCTDDVIATKSLPRRRHVRLHAATWDDLLLEEELDEVSSVSSADGDRHRDIRLAATAASTSTTDEVPRSTKPPVDEDIQSPPKIVRMAFCFDRNDGRVRGTGAIDKVARRLDPYDENPLFDVDGGETSSLEYTSSLECTSSLEYSDDDDDDEDDIKFEHWC